jgi:hypothetical protein
VAVNEEGARRLELLSPLLYQGRADPDPFSHRPRGREEWLFRFAIDKAQGQSIEPEAGLFLGPLCAAGRLETGPKDGAGPVFGGAGAEGPEAGEVPGEVPLPRGRYLFAQKREALGREAVIDLAIEVQKDGLWERLRLEDHFYLRYLYEEGSAVTQVFRPYREPEA